MGEEEAYNELLELAGKPEGEFKVNIKGKCPKTEPTKQVKGSTYKDYTNIILELYNKQTDQDKAYL